METNFSFGVRKGGGWGYVGYGLHNRAIEKWVLREIGCKGMVWNCVVQDRVKIWAVVKTVMSIRIITEDYLGRPNVTDWLVACMCRAVYVPEIYFAGFTCRVQNCNNYISNRTVMEGFSNYSCIY